jgi:two-component system, OmpR family, response regulator
MQQGSGQAPRILITEDDEFLRELLATSLRFAGFDVRAVGDGEAALATAPAFRPSLIVMDVMMPGVDGFEVCRRLRADGDTTPVIFLTARDAIEDKLEGFGLGGDDYLTKSFNLDELIARIRAVLQRSGAAPASGPTHRCADLVLDEDTHRVWRADQQIDLTPTEFRLLRYLLVNAGKVLSKSQILDHVWSYDFDGDASIVENCMSNLRKKVDADRVKLLHTIRGVGYTVRSSEQ